MFSAKLVFFLAFVVVVATALPKRTAGGTTPLRGKALKEAKAVLEESLTQLAAGEGPDYTISKVKSATRQVVSGIVYNYNANLTNEDGEVKSCKVSIWSQPWVDQGTQVTIECQGEEKVVANY